MLTPELAAFYETNGYVVVPQVFARDEVASYIEHYMALRRHPREGDTAGVVANSASDTNQQYPRMIHMHRWDDISLRWMLDDRLNQIMTALIGHYIDGAADEVGAYYHPALRMDGSVIELGFGEGGSSCGIWVNEDGTPMIEMAGVEMTRRKHE